MHEWQNLSHVRWDCKYHAVFVPKYRRKVFYGRLRRQIGEILRELCRQRGIDLVEGHAMPDHVHLCLSIPPKYSVAHAIGFLKGKSAVRIHRELLQERRITGLHFLGTAQIRGKICSKGFERLFEIPRDGESALPGTCDEEGGLRKGLLAVIPCRYGPRKPEHFMVNNGPK
jgi:putative transposase